MEIAEGLWGVVVCFGTKIFRPEGLISGAALLPFILATSTEGYRSMMEDVIGYAQYRLSILLATSENTIEARLGVCLALITKNRWGQEVVGRYGR